MEVGDDWKVHETGMRGVVSSMAFQEAHGALCEHFIWANITDAGVEAAVILNGLESGQVLDMILCTFQGINACYGKGISEFIESLVGKALVNFESKCTKK